MWGRSLGVLEFGAVLHREIVVNGGAVCETGPLGPVGTRRNWCEIPVLGG